MIKLSKNNSNELDIIGLLDFIEKIAGHDWMENWVHGMRDNFGRLPQNVPPLAVSWLKAKDELAAFQLTDNLKLSESTVRLLQLGDDLKLLRDYKDIGHQITLLKGNVEQYSHVCYQMYIAAHYHRKKVNFILPSDISQPDLTLLDKHQQTAVATVAPVLENGSMLVKNLPLIINNIVTKLANKVKVIYIDFPLPPCFTVEQFAEEVVKQNRLTPLDANISVIITISYVKSQPVPSLNHSIVPLR
ncbi:hypothetical protein V6C27_03860 [Peptococcaceae bacterium 1198_IL3148]